MMDNRSIVVLILISLDFCYFSYACNDTLKQGERLMDSDLLMSSNGRFRLGFFSLDAGYMDISFSGPRYLGIWFEEMRTRYLVWVGNRKNPIPDTSGALEIDSNGNLKITYKGSQEIVLSTNIEMLTTQNVSAALLESGNLVLRKVNLDGKAGNILWQSFDYPTNVLVPGMKLGMNLKTRHTWSLSSWISEIVPAPGAFRIGLDPNGTDQIIVWRRNEIYWTSGVWKNGTFLNQPRLTERVDDYEYMFVKNEEEKYFTYRPRVNSTVSRWKLDLLGQIMQFTWRKSTGYSTWISINGPCNLSLTDQSAVCLNEKPSRCRSSFHMFVLTKGYMSASAMNSYEDPNLDLALSDCHASCWNNCSCAAYKSLSENGLGCQFWSSISSFVAIDKGSDIYVLTTENNGNTGGISARAKAKTDRLGIISKWWFWTATALVLGLLVTFGCLYIVKRKQKINQKGGRIGICQDKSTLPPRSRVKFSVTKRVGRENSSQELPLFDFFHIMTASDNFAPSNKLGEGGFGPVYKGILPDGQQIAIKRLSRSSGQGLIEFKNEIRLIAELQHTNLVRLLGCCIHGEEKMLVYEFMPNKSLDYFLFNPERREQLDWKARLTIIDGITQGLLYLHKYSRLRVIHRDLKASNILLDSNMNPKISDFGMARIFGQNESEANTNRIVGTYGYMSPEYAMNGIFSVKSDVYSFGVLVLEIVSGKRSKDFANLSSALSIIEHAWKLWRDGSSLQLVDESISSISHENELMRCIHVGLLCVQECAVDRPTMSEIVSMLTNENLWLPQPKQPAFFIRRNENDVAPTSNRVSKCSDDNSNGLSISVVEGR